MRIIFLVIISILFSACPRVRTNTQRFPAPNIFFTDDKENRVITQLGFVKTPQKQELLTGSGAVSKYDADSNHMLGGGWFKLLPDLALGAALSPIKSINATVHYKIYNSEGINLYGGLQVFNDYGNCSSVSAGEPTYALDGTRYG